MTENFTLLAGWLAGTISFVATARYIVAILRGGTRPNRATWWILTLVGGLVAVSYLASGARHTMWIPVSYVVGPLLVALLSLRFGEGGWTRFDRYCVVSALLGALVWMISESSFAALQCFLVIDFVGLLPTFRKSYLDPESEDRWAWLLAAIAAAVNLLAVERWEASIAVYPVYIVVGNGAIAALLFLPQKVRLGRIRL